MNCSNKFKLTAVAMMVGTAMNANAALYQVVEVSPENVVDETVYGVAIQQGDVETDPATGAPYALGCFDSDAGCQPETFKLALETRTSPISAGQAVDGVSYREEVPFASDARFYTVENTSDAGDDDDFKTYCYDALGYSTCDSWAALNWKPWQAEKFYKDFTSNAKAFVEEADEAYDNQYNNVINSLTHDLKPIGNQSVVSEENPSQLETRNRVVAPTKPNIVTEDGQAEVVESRAWNTDGNYTVGSISRKYTNDNGTHHTSKAAIWDSSSLVSEVPWRTDQAEDGDRLAQGSMRDLVVDGLTIYGVGYNTYSDNNYLNASVFVGKTNTAGSLEEVSWTSKAVAGARQREDEGDGEETVHSNSRLTDVNENYVAIGEAKRRIVTAGALPNRLFIVEDIRADSLKAFYPNTGIFFYGSGGKMGGINKYNEIVGQIDAESSREYEGKPRRKRGFIYPYALNGQESERAKSLFEGKAWLLDNLTNGSNDGDSTAQAISEKNNEYRIIDATDINDAGVISATAMKCEGGYKSTDHNASCDGTEKIVAVKLMPIAGATSADIQQRSIEDEASEREGAGLGWLALTMLGLFGFRRK
ncbi:DUF3466 family protein [Vibrio owensii]|uniref:DUF3466 family protein n=1 Tax=Vibrio owensii TaxID=696485 RepID=UPI0005F02EA9|nr:DUF3466 family protein [Vibrio owensii]